MIVGATKAVMQIGKVWARVEEDEVLTMVGDVEQEVEEVVEVRVVEDLVGIVQVVVEDREVAAVEQFVDENPVQTKSQS